jgi:hypothetical protein
MIQGKNEYGDGIVANNIRALSTATSTSTSSCAVFSNNKASSQRNTTMGNVTRYKGKQAELASYTGRPTFNQSIRGLLALNDDDISSTKLEAKVVDNVTAAAREKRLLKKKGWYIERDDNDEDEDEDSDIKESSGYNKNGNSSRGGAATMLVPSKIASKLSPSISTSTSTSTSTSASASAMAQQRETERIFVSYGLSASPDQLSCMTGNVTITDAGMQSTRLSSAKVLSQANSTTHTNTTTHAHAHANADTHAHAHTQEDRIDVHAHGRIHKHTTTTNTTTKQQQQDTEDEEGEKERQKQPQPRRPYGFEERKDYHEQMLDHLQMQTAFGGTFSS